MRGARTATRCAADVVIQVTLDAAAEPCRAGAAAHDGSRVAGIPSTVTHDPRP